MEIRGPSLPERSLNEILNDAKKDINQRFESLEEELEDHVMGFKVSPDTQTPVVVPTPDTDEFAITVQTTIISDTVTSSGVDVGVTTNEKCQCLSRVHKSGEANWTNKNNETSFLYGQAGDAPNGSGYGHYHKIRQLDPSSTYDLDQILTDMQGNVLSSTSVQFTTSAAAVPTGTNTPPAGRNSVWEGLGYSIVWQDTPSVDDVGMLLKDYIETDHWKGAGGDANYYDSDGASTPNVVALCPLDDTPALHSFIPYNELNGILFQGTQMSDEGLDNVASIVYSMDIYTPLEAAGGIVHHGPGDAGLLSPPDDYVPGIYVGFGPHSWSKLGARKSPGGGKQYEDAASFRVPIGSSGQFYCYNYNYHSYQKGWGHGQFLLPDTNSYIWNARGKWTTIELVVTPNLPAATYNDTVEIYIDGAQVLSNSGIRFFKEDNIRPKGFGVFHQHNKAVNPLGEHLYVANMKMFAKYRS